jgi:hypothetical protein
MGSSVNADDFIVGSGLNNHNFGSGSGSKTPPNEENMSIKLHEQEPAAIIPLINCICAKLFLFVHKCK